MKCPNCDSMTVNGVYIHEIGCNTDYLHTIRECAWCGQEFQPKHQDQAWCTKSCEKAYSM